MYMRLKPMTLTKAKAFKETSIPAKWTTPKECRHLAPRLASGMPTDHTTKLRRCVGNRYIQIVLEYALPIRRLIDNHGERYLRPFRGLLDFCVATPGRGPGLSACTASRLSWDTTEVDFY